MGEGLASCGTLTRLAPLGTLSQGERVSGKNLAEPPDRLEYPLLRQSRPLAAHDEVVDAEEFVQGLVCVAVPVSAPGQAAVRCAVALQAPAARMPLAKALQQVGRLAGAAQALGRTL